MHSKSTVKQTLVIRLDRDEIRIALMPFRTSPPTILHSVTVPSPTGAVEDGMILRSDLLRDALKTALTAPEFNEVRSVVFSLCSSQVISETVSVPEAFKNKLDQMLHANMDIYFPVDVTDHHLIWKVLGASVNESDAKHLNVQLWAVPKTLLNCYYTLADDCGLSVTAIDWCGNSLTSAVGASYSAPELTDIPTATALYLVAENEHLMMTFVHSGHVRLQRVLRCGSDPYFALSEAAIVTEYYSTTFSNFSLDSLNCTLWGKLAGDSDFVQRVSSELNIPAQAVSAAPHPEWCLCLGASQSCIDFGLPARNCPSSRRKSSRTMIQNSVLLASVFAFTGVLLLLLTSGTIWNQELLSLHSTQTALQHRSEQTEVYAQQYHAYTSAYEQYSSDWDAIFSSLRTPNDNLVLVLQELATAIPEATCVESIDIQSNSLHLTFLCVDKVDAASLIQSLRRLQYASPDSISDLKFSAEGTLSFSVVLGYHEELIQAELDRKGISYDDKLPPLSETEVVG